MKLAFGFLIAFSLGAFCRYFDLPCPAPNMLFGALLVVSTTVGYLAMNHYLS